MLTQIKITIANISLDGELFDTPCAQAIAGVLPIETTPDEWGDEFYFGISVAMPLDRTATKKVEIGDIGYWPPGKALAIFFGPTPMSKGAEPVPASEVNLVGRIVGNSTLLRKAKGSRRIRIERI